MKKYLMLAGAFAVMAQGMTVTGDAKRGAELFSSQKCINCHSLNGEGGKTAPDLGRKGSRALTPPELAALMWNHAPQMWAAMDAAQVSRPKIDSAQAADLFAYFYAARFFDRKGDAARGRKAFVDKGCATCHNVTVGADGVAPAVAKWDAVSDPVELARQMWNHSAAMKSQMAARKLKQPQLTAEEMNDITVYLQGLPQAKKAAVKFAPASAETGETLLSAKGCAGCHTGAKALPKAGVFRAPAEIAAAMWNHQGKSGGSGELRPEEMSRLVGYLWSKQFENEGGAPARGAKLFEAKGCQGCHVGGAGPKIQPGRLNSYEMIAVLWGHGPSMQKEMKGRGVAWPRFENSDMADLIAYLRQGR